MNWPNLYNSPSERPLSKEELQNYQALSNSQKAAIVDALQQDEAVFSQQENTETTTEKNYIEKLKENEYFTWHGDEAIIKLKKWWWAIPIAFYDQPGEAWIAAIQEFDPASPENNEVINHAQSTIDDAIKKWFIQNNPQDQNFVEFCIYAANKEINKKWPNQDDDANSQVVEKSIQEAWWVVTQTAIEQAWAQVCKDFAPLFATILENNNAGNVHLVSSKSEEHMYTLVDIPWHWIQRIDAKKNPETVWENTVIDLYEEFWSTTSLN